jgi:hypothetical protein
MPVQGTPVHSIDEGARIRVIFKGFIVAHIQTGAETIEIGALNPAASAVPDLCHQPKVYVYTINKGSGETSVRSDFNNRLDFSIEVDKHTPTIQVFWKNDFPFVTFDVHNHPKDFRWFVNLNQIHGLTGLGGNALTVKPNALSPIFTLNDGLLHTSDRSDGEVILQELGADGLSVESERAFGRFALEITARIYLEGDETANFFNGGLLPVITARAAPPEGSEDDDIVYDIVFDCRCLTNEDISDFGHIYDVFTLPRGTNRVNMKADVLSAPDARTGQPHGETAGKDLAASPETYCTGGTYP